MVNISRAYAEALRRFNNGRLNCRVVERWFPVALATAQGNLTLSAERRRVQWRGGERWSADERCSRIVVDHSGSAAEEE